jgi:6-phosphogluconolactonase
MRVVGPDPAAACAKHVLEVLSKTLETQEFATFAVSGGTSPRVLFDELAATKFPWDRVHLFFVDERCVPPTHPASNFRLAEEHLIRPAVIPEPNVHRIAGEAVPEVAAEQYSRVIGHFFGVNGQKMPQFDLIHRGMGPDAHTASLFPGEPLIENRDGIAAGVYVEKFNSWRVTLLPGVLLAAKHTVVLVAGADKAEAVRAVLREPYDPKKYPAQIANDPRGVVWFLDEAAAKLLD